MSNEPAIEIHQQTAFDEDGELEVTETSVETSLKDYDADVDHRERESRLDRPEASDFGEDEQTSLFADTDADQQTLTGEAAAMRCLFGD